jgi:hypothetical protein
MQLFNSIADTVLIFLLVASNIIVGIAQYRVIKAQATEIKTIKAANDAIKNLNDAQLNDIKSYKEMVNLDNIDRYINIQVSVKIRDTEELFKEYLEEKVELDVVMKVARQYAIEELSDFHKKFFHSNFIFILFVINKNNMSENKINEMVETFFPDAPIMKDLIKDALPSFTIGRELVDPSTETKTSLI